MNVPTLTNAKEQPASLRQHIYQDLKQQIITCQLAPGQIVNEGHLAKQLGVSTTPVREALTKLHHDHLVQPIERKGYLITTLTLKDIQEIFEVRLVLERAITELATERVTDEDLQRLEHFLELEFDPQDRDAMYRQIESNRDFHMTISGIVHNDRLHEHFERVFVDAQRLQYMDLERGKGREAWARDHERIVDALRRRDKEAAGLAVVDALEEARTRLLGL